MARGAFVYIRNPPSTSSPTIMRAGAVEYGLADGLRSRLDRCDQVIDDDLGRSGSASAVPARPAARGDLSGRVGAVFTIEASRLARNGHDWRTLIEVLRSGWHSDR